MGLRGVKGKANAKIVTASGALTVYDLSDYAVVRVDTANVVIALPGSASLNSSYSRIETTFLNATSGYVFLFSADGFLNSYECVAIAPYGSAKVGVVHRMTSSPAWVWMVEGHALDVVQSYTPTETWSTATPTTTTNFNYMFKNGTVFFTCRITGTDGAGGTDLTLSLPIRPLLSGAEIPITAQWSVAGAAPVNALGYVDAGTNGNIAFRNPQTCTDDAAFEINLSGFYEVFGWNTWSVTETWATGTPTGITEVARYKQFGDAICFVYFASSADSTGATGLTVPLPVIPQDLNTYLAVNSIQLAGAGGATYSNPKGFIDSTHATAASRYLSFADWTTATDNQAVKAAAAGFYFVREPQTGTMTPTWGTADPASATVTEHFSVDGGLAFLNLYMTSADGNAASSCVLTPMFPARKACEKIALAGYEIVNATKSAPAAYLDTDHADWDDRTLEFGAFSAWTNAVTTSMYVSGFAFL